MTFFYSIKKEKTNEILQTINNTTENIKFTMEEEQNYNSLSWTFFWQELMTAQYKHRFIERKRILINYWTITVTIPLKTK
jgi:hypothetical protein